MYLFNLFMENGISDCKRRVATGVRKMWGEDNDIKIYPPGPRQCI